MIYEFTHKETGRIQKYNSLPFMSTIEEIPLDTLKYHFTRKKRDHYETDDFKIEKLKKDETKAI